MNLLSDVITYIRRIIKSPSNSTITDDLLIDYINRFWIMDVDARIQLFDLKTKYSFMTSPGVDKYNMPLYNIQLETGSPTSPGTNNQSISYYPVYQGFLGPAYINGIPVHFETQQQLFYSAYPNVIQNPLIIGRGDGTSGPYSLQIPIIGQQVPPNPPFNCILRGHVDVTGVIASTTPGGVIQDPPLVTNTEITNQNKFIQNVPVTSVDSALYITSIDSTGANIEVRDSGQFLADNVNYGLLMQPGSAPYGNLPLPGPTGANYSTTLNTVNYFNGQINVQFPVAVPAGANIYASCYFFQSGLPRTIFYYNNTITMRSPPALQYLVELETYLSPAAFMNTGQALQFSYMAEYIARGAARKILSDTGDVEQFQFYEPLFREQESLVWKRSQRQWTATRTQTLYSRGNHGSNGNYGGMGGSVY